MPYALSNLVNGEVPSFRYILNPNEAAPGEVVMEDKDFLPKQGWVWDSATNALRQPTAADRLRFAKRRKKSDFEANAESQMRSIIPPYRLTMLVARDARSDSRLADATLLDQKLDRALNAVDAKTTTEAVDAMRWEDQI